MVSVGIVSVSDGGGWIPSSMDPDVAHAPAVSATASIAAEMMSLLRGLVVRSLDISLSP